MLRALCRRKLRLLFRLCALTQSSRSAPEKHSRRSQVTPGGQHTSKTNTLTPNRLRLHTSAVSISERALISEIRKRTASLRKGAVRVGIGDDCAVLSILPDEELLVTTDLCLEGMHFMREWQTPESIGRWCVTRGLSDIAAMAGRPVAAFVSFACPQDTDAAWIGSFFAGVTELAAEYDFTLAGGDTGTFPSAIIADVLLIGAAPKGAAVLRSGASPGDLIYVTGRLGAPQAELSALLSGELEHRSYTPVPQLKPGQKLRGTATAMIDISDGLSTDLAHICEESGVSAEIESSAIPIAKGADLKAALHGGDEYQLLFTARPTTKPPIRASQIGRIVRQRRHPVYLNDGQSKRPLANADWQHRL